MKKKRFCLKGLVRQHVQKGFTLIEVLVALAITGMLVSILMSSLFYIFRVQDGIQAEVVEREQLLRSHAWFRSVIGGCLPLEAQAPGGFMATKNELVCETSTPILSQKFPTPVRVILSLAQEKGMQVLRYQETEDTSKLGFIVHKWASEAAWFEYVNTKGEISDSWPVRTTMSNEAIPQLVRLVVQNRDVVQTVWVAPLRADPWLPEKQKLPFELPQ